ncbi:hypothetical protein Ahy_B05g079416 [Arachis hypogaea]|uniref:Uncharacterized protein n=1 Tax=Arachis hypogaea TaxID=3818 RepID=A0A444Z9S2_ARAHY|nr:hypothetical protein Ahy_B05g079416 [Arachis hypogaea]
MSQNLHLRGPHGNHQSQFLRPLHEPLRQVLRRPVPANSDVEICAGSIALNGWPHHPNKPLHAELQSPRKLPNLSLRHGPSAPERHVDYRFRRLPVKPLHNLVVHVYTTRVTVR